MIPLVNGPVQLVYSEHSKKSIEDVLISFSSMRLLIANKSPDEKGYQLIIKYTEIR